MKRESGLSLATICGVGTVTGYGWGKKHLWDGLLKGDSAVRPHSGFGSRFDRDSIWVSLIPDEGGVDGETKFTRSLHAAAREAIEDARERGWGPGPTGGVIRAGGL